MFGKSLEDQQVTVAYLERVRRDMTFSRLKLARLIDYTLIKATATKDDVIKLYQDAKKYEFRCVVANPFYVSLVHRILNATNAKVCSTVGFPIVLRCRGSRPWKQEEG